jgi:hypothetical protein
VKPVLERVSFGKLASHPARTSPMGDDCGHSAYVCYRMTVGKFAKTLQLSHQLQYDVLMNIVRLFTLCFAKGVQAEFETNDAFDYGFGVDGNEL